MQKKDKLKQFLEHGDIVILDELDNISDKLDAISPAISKLAEIDAEPYKGEVGEQGPEGERGPKGYAPIKGKDYFTANEIAEIIDICSENSKPTKGIDYKDGKDGVDGRDGKDGKNGSPDSPEEIAEKLNTLKEVLNADLIKGLFTKEDIIKEIKEKKLLSVEHISNMPSAGQLDQRWHGGGKSRFLQLIDTPASFSGQANRLLEVNSTEDAVVFGLKITVGTTQPSNPSVGDLWVDTN